MESLTSSTTSSFYSSSLGQTPSLCEVNNHKRRNDSSNNGLPAKKVKVISEKDGLIGKIDFCSRLPFEIIELIASFCTAEEMEVSFCQNECVLERQGNAILHQVRAQDSLTTKQIYFYNKLINKYGLANQASAHKLEVQDPSFAHEIEVNGSPFRGCLPQVNECLPNQSPFQWIKSEIFSNLTELEILGTSKYDDLLQTLTFSFPNLQRLVLDASKDFFENKNWQLVVNALLANHPNLTDLFWDNAAPHFPVEEVSENLTALTLERCTSIKASDYIAMFKKFFRLTSLSINDCENITDNVLKAVPHKTITYFRLNVDQKFSSENLRACLSQLINLQNLSMNRQQCHTLDSVISNKLIVLGLEM